jgi:hypothetical protein
MTRLTVRLVTVLVCFAFGSLLSHAQNQRSFVSGVGSDANPCTRTAPCATFNAAFSQTNPNGEINVLDPGNYGSLFIYRSITVDATGTFAGIVANGGIGIVISITPGTDAVHTVRLRGLSISGAGNNAKAGSRGIDVLSNSVPDLKVIIEDTVVDGFVNEGILYSSNGGDLVVKNSVVVQVREVQYTPVYGYKTNHLSSLQQFRDYSARADC